MWEKLRDKYFKECTIIDGSSGIRIDIAPHDLFEWFKKEFQKELEEKNNIIEAREAMISNLKLYIPNELRESLFGK